MGIELRVGSGEAHLEQIAALKGRIDPILQTTVDDLRFWQARVRGALHLIAFLEEEPAGFGVAGVYPEQEDESFAFADLGVLPEARGHTVGSTLLAALSDHVRALGKQGLQLEVREQDEDGLDYFAKRGYVEVERQKALELDLTTLHLARPLPPADVEIVTWAERPDLVERMYGLYQEASADIPGLDAETGWTFDEWRSFELDRPTRRHDLSVMALAGDELVGYATLDVFPAGGFHGLTAVARAWRRRGVGRALKRSQIAAAKAAGLEKLYTESEERNEPMRRLNESLGFRPIPGMVVMRGPLAR